MAVQPCEIEGARDHWDIDQLECMMEAVILRANTMLTELQQNIDDDGSSYQDLQKLFHLMTHSHWDAYYMSRLKDPLLYKPIAAYIYHLAETVVGDGMGLVMCCC